MEQNKSKKYTRIIILNILFITSFFLMLFSISDLKLGKGLGREVILLTNDIAVEYESDFNDFKKYTKNNKIEYTYSKTDSDRVLVEFSGVEDVERFTDDLKTHIPGLLIYELGTFNSISSVTKTANTIQSYFVVFFIAFITIWTYRYRLLGLYGSIFSVFNILLSLIFSNYFGYLFDYKMWFSSLIVFIALVLLKGWTIYYVNRYYEPTELKRTYFLVFLLFLNSSILLFILDPVFHGSATFVGISAILIAIELLIMHFYLNKFEATFLHDSRFKPYVEKRSGIRMPDMINDKVLMIILSVLILSFTLISFIGFYQTEKHNPSFSKENYLIVDDNDAITFLEVQASLGKSDLSKNLLEYRISEDKKTWFIFDEFTNWYDLKMANTSIKDKLDINASVVAKDNYSLKFSPKLQASLFVLFLTMNFILIYSIGNINLSKKFLLSISLFYAFIYMFKHAFNLNESFEYIIFIILIPIINTLSLLFINHDKNILENMTVANILGYLFTILGLLILPMILFIPDLSVELLNIMQILFNFALSYILNLFLMSYLISTKGVSKYD